MRVVRRLAGAVAMIYVVTSGIFFLVHIMPGNPYALVVSTLLKQGYSLTQAENQARVLFGFQANASLPQQYVQYLGLLLHGNLGTSVMYPGQPVMEIIAKALPWTVFIVSVALLVSFALGIVLGAIAAYLRGTWFDHLVTQGSSLLNGVPLYLTAIVLFYFLAVLLRWFPMGGAYSPYVPQGLNLAFLGSVLAHAILPILAFVLSSFAGWALSMKSSTISVLGEDFITAARAMAIKDRYVVWSYVSRNAILPLFTGFVLSIGFIFGGSLYVEQVFNYPGLGNLFYMSTQGRDFPLMEGCFFLLTTAVILANVVADLLYSTLDPRIRE